MLRLILSSLVLVALCSHVAAAQSASEPQAQPGDQLTVPAEPSRLMRLREPILMVAEGLDGLVDAATLRARLSQIFNRPVIALSDTDAGAAVATLWVSISAHELVLRLSGQGRADLWQRLPRETLGADAAEGIARAVLDMLWSERIAAEGRSEMVDPFCPPGLVCRETFRSRTPRQQRSDSAVLDPWDGAYQRFGPLDSVIESPRYHQREGAWPEPVEQAAPAAPTAPTANASGATAPASWALALLAGGGVHGEGGFARYQVDAMRRFTRFDVGLSFVGGRGQPDAAQHVRRGAVALFQRRFVMQALEVDLAANLGLMVNTQRQSTEVRPYLRGLLIFAVLVHDKLSLILQNELGTTFDDAAKEGALEYALSLGLRFGI